ncbi:unnamed protein product [marine sediment metagenome]|uniref:Uncharacterized protein n=1 Tax=marine sediment metagenome TaxID=412755 RepID=X1CTX8_9ZZZZ
MGKGSWKRPRSISREEEDLRWAYAQGNMTYAYFRRRYADLKRAGLIRRSGRVLK